jgi:hypothetical protein
MHMGVDGLDQSKVQLFEQLYVAANPVEDRVYDQCLAAASAGEEVGVGGRLAVEKLAKNNRLLLPRYVILH